PAVCAFRNNVFLDQQFERIRHHLEQSPRSDAHRTQTHLHPRDNFTLSQRDDRDIPRHDRQNQGDLDQRYQNVVDCKIHYLSISPKTISSVPMIATTSATIWPATIFRSDWRFTNDGGLTRAR